MFNGMCDKLSYPERCVRFGSPSENVKFYRAVPIGSNDEIFQLRLTLDGIEDPNATIAAVWKMSSTLCSRYFTVDERYVVELNGVRYFAKGYPSMAGTSGLQNGFYIGGLMEVDFRVGDCPSCKSGVVV